MGKTARRITIELNMEYLKAYYQINGFVPSAALTFTCSAFLYRFRTSMWGLAVLAFPGTVAHEFAHFLVGLVLWAKPKNFTVFPKRSQNTWILGSVSFAKINLLNAAFVAMAPLLLVPLSWYCLVYVVIPCWRAEQFVWWVLSGYLSANFLFGAIPSSQDFKVGGFSIVMYGTMLGGWLLASLLS